MHDVLTEGYSDDTVGNAFFLRVMHADLRPDWVHLRIITSEFQIRRTQTIYRWLFELMPMPRGKHSYVLSFRSVDDEGALPAEVLSSRRVKEASSLRAFWAGELARMRRLEQVHQFMYTQHSAYSAQGMLSKKAMNASSAVAQTY